MSQRFHISDVNPNEACGGGGCVCSESKLPEATGPYTIFFVGETNSNISPHVVVCAPCIDKAHERLDGEVLSAGERDPIEEALPEAETTSGSSPGDADEDVPEV